jgi:hypothetical protein
LTAVATAIGPALGGWLVQAVSWRAVFFLNLPIAAAALLIASTRVAETHSPSAARLDWPGAFFATCGLGALVYGLIEAPTAGWGDVRVFGSMSAGAAALAAFLLVEPSRTPMVPPRLFRIRAFGHQPADALPLRGALGRALLCPSS